MLIMAERPTSVWRENVAQEASDLAAGTLDPDDAYAARLWPEGCARKPTGVFDGFEADAADLVNHRWQPATDPEIFEVIERTVKALNGVNLRYVDDLARRHRMTRHEITDE